MIGGIMLMCAVAAMLLLATWSLARDDDSDSKARDGILALRDTSENIRSKRHTRNQSKVQKRHSDRRPPRATPVRERGDLNFDPDEMAEIAEEAEATLPAFIRNSRETY